MFIITIYAFIRRRARLFLAQISLVLLDTLSLFISISPIDVGYFRNDDMYEDEDVVIEM